MRDVSFVLVLGVRSLRVFHSIYFNFVASSSSSPQSARFI